LWDRIIGYDRLDLLPLLAVAILAWREHQIMKVIHTSEVDVLFADLSMVKVIPLLMYILG